MYLGFRFFSFGKLNKFCWDYFIYYLFLNIWIFFLLCMFREIFWWSSEVRFCDYLMIDFEECMLGDGI